MKYSFLDCHVRGTMPVIYHNVRLANPLDPLVQAIKSLTSKPAKKKTDDDHAEISRLEFMGGLYLDKQERVVVPSRWIEGVVVAAAQGYRKGPAARTGVVCPEDAPLLYKGPKTPEALFAHPDFVDRRMMRPRGQGMVLRTRPIFPAGWEVKFRLEFLPEVVNERDLKTWLDDAGMKGVGDSHGRYGRFEVLAAQKVAA